MPERSNFIFDNNVYIYTIFWSCLFLGNVWPSLGIQVIYDIDIFVSKANWDKAQMLL